MVAADGWSYEFSAIQEWLKTHNTTPMAPSLELSHKHLIPNLCLAQAIKRKVFDIKYYSRCH